MFLTISIILLCTLGYLLLNAHIYNVRRQYRHIKSPTIPRNLTWFLGCLPDFRKRLAESPNASGCLIFMQYHKEYKWDLFVLPLFTENAIFCLELDILSKVVADWRTFPKDQKFHRTMSSVNGVRIFGEYGIVSDPGTEIWKAKRKTMEPGFHKSFMRSVMPDMNTVLNNLTECMSTKAGGGVFDVCSNLNRAAFEAMSICVLNMDSDLVEMHGDKILEALPRIFESMSLSVRDPTYKFPWKYVKEKKALNDTVPAIRDVVKKILQDRMKSNPIGSPDLLSYLIKSNQCSDQLTIDDLVDDYLTFLIAGIEATAITLAVTLFYLANNNEILSKVRNEIDCVIKRGQMVGFDDVNKLEYLEMVIKECMRVKPPMHLVRRCCGKANVVVNGLKIPKGAALIIPIFALHHDPRYWEQPEVFDPERFSAGFDKNIKKLSYLPFAAGGRSCIGKNFAMLELKSIISRIVQEFDIVNPYPEVTDLKMSGMITIGPREGVELELHPRPVS